MNNSLSATPKSYIKKTWPVILAFFGLTLVDPHFGLAGLLCMSAPLILAISGRGKRHCSHYCPRGSFFGKFLPHVSLDLPFPKWMEKKKFKTTLLVWMFGMFGISLFFAGTNLTRISLAITRIMLSSFIVGMVIGIFFKPRSWCKICPMGTASGMISNVVAKK